VFDGDRDIGRIYLVESNAGTETWFWGVDFVNYGDSALIF
jgi:hypothetical protein